MKASIICLTYLRTDMARKVIDHNLANTGLDSSQYEVLLTDQGAAGTEFIESERNDFIKYLKSLPLSYLRLNHYNEGISRSLNQMMIRAKGKHIFFMASDILLPDNWLKVVTQYADDIPKSGVVGFEGQDLILPKIKVPGLSGEEYEIHCNEETLAFDGSQVYGSTLMTRELIDTIGYFDEGLSPYSYEDQDLLFRAKWCGLMNYYIPNHKFEHIGIEEPSDEYKKFKLGASFSNIGYFRWKTKNYHRIGAYISAPMMREPFE